MKTSTGENNPPKALKIDVDSVLRQRLPRHYRFIPKPLVSWLKRFICQERMNQVLEQLRGLEGADFCAEVLRIDSVSYDIAPGGVLPPPSQRRVIFACNHPLGGLDGMILIDLLTRHYGVEPLFVVNDLLSVLTPLQRVFLPINKHGRQSREELQRIEQALEGDRPIIYFPAGLVSRRADDGTIRDLRWKKSFINHAIRYKRHIIPLFFDGENTQFFYKFARWRVRLGMKFNIEMIRLPAEMFYAEGKHFDIYVGDTIPYTSLRGGSSALDEAESVKRQVYNLKHSETDS